MEPRAEEYLDVIRTLLRRDYLTTADWDSALRDFAQMARHALNARETMVAIHDDAAQSWSACTSDGSMLEDEGIALYGSRSVLERVRRTERPILTTLEQPLLLDSESIAANEVTSVLAVPLYFWDVRERTPKRTFGGCLYAHRSGEDGPFTGADVELVRDLTELAQRTLNLLLYVRDIQSHLADSEAQLGELRREAAGRFRLGRYESHDPWFARNVIEPLRRISYAHRINLLILGPSGSGKSYLAQSYHYECPRAEKPFVVLDCSQVLSAETLGPELFGYARDSGYANAPKKGLVGKAELANGGTLFIDEIACLPAVLQQQLLRLIHMGRFSPLGSSEEKQVDIQVIAATNADLVTLVQEGRFREDLYQRLGEFTVELPALNERAADIPVLARRFLAAARERFGRRDLADLSEDAAAALMRHDWSANGNIRGLEHAVNRSVLLAPKGARHLCEKHLELDRSPEQTRRRRLGAGAAPAWSRTVPGQGELTALRTLMQRKIEEHRGVITAVAGDPEVAAAYGEQRVPMPLSTLRLRLRRVGLEEDVEQARQRRDALLDAEALRKAILDSGSGTAAAAALGITRDSLIWHLRKAGLTVRDVLAGPEA
jgi:transcriptional regulator with GAF, ATPase, and Fis domain